MNTTQKLAALIRRRGDVRSCAHISTETFERFRDHAAENGLDASREHYEYILAARAQVTARQWFRLPKAERQRRVTEFRAADAALQACEPPGGGEETTYFRFHDQFSELWLTVPWWCRL